MRKSNCSASGLRNCKRNFVFVFAAIRERPGVTALDKKTLLPVTSDFVFKLIFGDQRNIDILAAFLKAVLDIPKEEYARLVIVDPHIKKESADDKFGILDVKLHTASGSIIHIEIQVRVLPNMKARTVYSQAKLLTEQMASGMDWSNIKRAISIIITNDVLIPEGNKYHYQFRYRTEDNIEFSKLSEINTLDLSKLPIEYDNSELWYWMKFIKADDEEVLDMLAANNPQMQKVVGILKELSADERTRMLYEEREMDLRDRRDIESQLRIYESQIKGFESLLKNTRDTVAEKDAVIAERTAALADKDAEIELLRKRIAELQT